MFRSIISAIALAGALAAALPAFADPLAAMAADPAQAAAAQPLPPASASSSDAAASIRHDSEIAPAGMGWG